MCGTTVSVGFVDLSVVAFSSLSFDVPANSPKDGLDHHFVLIDATAAHVALSMTLWQMARDGCSAKSFAQAWYSSIWNRATETAFKAAARSLLSEPNTKVSSKTRPFLAMWASSHSVPVKKAYASWSRHRAFEQADTLNLARKVDRMAHLRYLVTGQLFTDSDTETDLVGSLAMFTAPPDAPPLDSTEALQGIPVEKFSKALKENPKSTVIQVAEMILMDGVLKTLELAGKPVKIDFICEEVSLSNSKLITVLKALRPESVMWSNVMDYMSPKEFHKLAASIAKTDCLHMGYTINWHADTVGTCLLDWYENPALIAQVDGVVQDAVNANESYYKLNGICDRFVLPPPVNPINLTQGSLGVMFCKRWVEEYFKAASKGIPIVCEGEDMVFPAFAHWPFSRSQGSLTMIWTYDTDMTFLPKAPCE